VTAQVQTRRDRDENVRRLSKLIYSSGFQSLRRFSVNPLPTLTFLITIRFEEVSGIFSTENSEIGECKEEKEGGADLLLGIRPPLLRARKERILGKVPKYNFRRDANVVREQSRGRGIKKEELTEREESCGLPSK